MGPNQVWGKIDSLHLQAVFLALFSGLSSSRWRMSDDQDGGEWVNVSSGTGPPG